MSENLTMSELMDSFELKHFHKGEIVKGKVISVKNDEIIVTLVILQMVWYQEMKFQMIRILI